MDRDDEFQLESADVVGEGAEGYSDPGVTADLADDELTRGWSTADQDDDEASTGIDEGLTDGGTGTAIGADDDAAGGLPGSYGGYVTGGISSGQLSPGPQEPDKSGE